MRWQVLFAIALASTACSHEEEGLVSSTSTQGFPLDLEDPLPTDVDKRHSYQCWLGEGVTIARSANLGADDLPRLDTRQGELVYADIDLPGGRPARAVAVRFFAPRQAADADGQNPGVDGARPRGAEDHPVEIVVARSTHDVERTLSMLRWVLGATWLASMMTCAGILSWLVRRGLSPLNRLSAQIHHVDEDQLDRTFELPGAAEELAPVVGQLNGFVMRIREAFEREHAFTAHAAHELRTPLSGLRSTLEVSLSRTREPGEYEEAERACLTITMQLQRLVERLLELARASAPTAVKRRDAIDLETLVDECWLPLSDAAAERGVHLSLNVPADLGLESDRQLLRRVLQNLLENATDYADRDSAIELVAQRNGGAVRISCSNAAENVKEATAERVFDPFWRSDSARSATGMHAGLGLALCKSFVEVLGGRIAVKTTEGRFEVTVDLVNA